MTRQDARQDRNQFPAILGHSGTAGTSETRKIGAEHGAMWVDDVAPMAKIVDQSDGTTNYTGWAAPGAAAGDAVWRISRTFTGTTPSVAGTIEIGSPYGLLLSLTYGAEEYSYASLGTAETTTWADGDSSFDNIWSNRVALDYS